MKHITILILSVSSIASYGSQLVQNKIFTIYKATLVEALTELPQKVGINNYKQYAIIPVLEKDYHGLVVTQTASGSLKEVFIVCGDAQSENTICKLINEHPWAQTQRYYWQNNILEGYKNTPYKGAYIASLTEAALKTTKQEYDYLNEESEKNFNRLRFFMAKNLPQYYAQTDLVLHPRTPEEINHYNAQRTEQLQKTLHTIENNKSVFALAQSHVPLRGKITKKSRKKS